jgi:hypothetical protein
MMMLSCFDKSAVMAQPWAEAGYLCYCIDLQHPKGERREGNIIRVGADMHTWIPPRGDIVFASFFPPCTDLAVSGARWFKEKGLHCLARAISLFARCVDIVKTLECPWMIENPVSTISSYWRKPDYTFHPWEYGDPYSKKTCLWVGNGFVMPEKMPVIPWEGSKMHRLPPTQDRAHLRSLTPAGFARAVFKTHHERVREDDRA